MSSEIPWLSLPVSPPLSVKEKQSFNQKLTQSFLESNSSDVIKAIQAKSPLDIQQHAEKRALSLFQEAAERIPAYKDFLKKHKIQPGKVRTAKDFSQIPLTDKESYIQQYPLSMLVWDGNLDQYGMVAVSSGTTGNVTHWPRDGIMEIESDYIHEFFLHQYWLAEGKKTLVIVSFSMGLYTAGVLTSSSLQRLSAKNLPLLVSTPGLNLNDLCLTYKALQKEVDQIIIFGYPSFIKDFVDETKDKGIILDTTRTIFIAAGEVLPEGWREYIAQAADTQSHWPDIMALYGCSEKGILGHETPVTEMIRQASKNDAAQRQTWFGRDQVPSVYQYYPFSRYFESVQNKLVVTAAGGVPLLRYNLQDAGGVLSATDVSDYFEDKTKTDSETWTLPYIYVWGREETLTLYALNVYPKNVLPALHQSSINSKVSGRFVMQIERNARLDEQLVIHIELAAQIEPSEDLENEIKRVVVQTMRSTNAEYNKLYDSVGSKVEPLIKLYPKFYSQYFKRSGKHKYIIR